MSAHQSQQSEQMNITNIWNDFIKNKKIIKNLAKKMKNLDKKTEKLP
jgi:HD-like signal output (HDOD) protein